MPRLRKQSLDTRKRRTALLRKQETPEQRALRNEKSRVRAAIKRASETEEERAARLARDRTRIYSTRYTLKKKARSVNLQYVLNPTSSNCSDRPNLPDMNKNEKAAYRAYLLLETQRASAARSAADRRNRETFEQRAARLEKCRIRSAVSRACEDEETRAVRLARQRIRTNAARLKQRVTEVESQQRMSTNFNSIYYNHGKSFIKSLKQNPYSNHPAVGVKEFRNQLLIQQFHQLQLAYSLNAHLQATSNESQLAFNPSNVWPRFDNLGLVLGNSIVNPDVEEEKLIDEETEYSKSDIGVECEVTIEEENTLMTNPVFFKGEPTEEKTSLFDCELTTEENTSITNPVFFKGKPTEEKTSLFDCELTTEENTPMINPLFAQGKSTEGKTPPFDCELTNEENTSMTNPVFFKGKPTEEKTSLFDCELTTEENTPMINPLFAQGKSTEGKTPPFDCELTNKNKERMDNMVIAKSDPDDTREPVFETVMCGPTTVKQEAIDIKDNLIDDFKSLENLEQPDSSS